MGAMHTLLKTIQESNEGLILQQLTFAIKNGKLRALKGDEYYLIYTTTGRAKANVGKDYARFTIGAIVASPYTPIVDPFQAGSWGREADALPRMLVTFRKHRSDMGLHLQFPIIGDSHYPFVGKVDEDLGIVWSAVYGKSPETFVIQEARLYRNCWVDVTTITDLAAIYPTAPRPSHGRSDTPIHLATIVNLEEKLT